MHGGPRSAGRLGSSPFAGRCAGAARTPVPSCRFPANERTHSHSAGRVRMATAARSRNVMWMDVDAGVDDAQGIDDPHQVCAASAASWSVQTWHEVRCCARRYSRGAGVRAHGRAWHQSRSRQCGTCRHVFCWSCCYALRLARHIVPLTRRHVNASDSQRISVDLCAGR